MRVDKCGRCETEYADIYRCIDKLGHVEFPPCNINSNKTSISDPFICNVCTVEEMGEKALHPLLEYLKVEYELKQKALTTTGNESYTCFM